MNNNEKLIHYLNSGVKGKICRNGVCIVDFITCRTIELLNTKQIDSVTPYLYPISCLTETIIHNGVEETPLVELAKISGVLHGFEKIEIVNKLVIKWVTSQLNVESFEYHISRSFCSYGLERSFNVFNQLLLFQKCFDYRINMFPDEIDSIDPRELGDGNPYLLTGKK